MRHWAALYAPWLVGVTLVGAALLILRRPLGRLWRLGVRSVGGLAALALLNPLGQLVGITLGINWVNALVLGMLGTPGLGLLLMLQWVLQCP